MKKVWPPMLAVLSKPSEAEGNDYFFEVKYDGFRALAAISGAKVALWSRNALDLSGRFPEVVAALTHLAVGEAVIDGEVVADDAQGVSRFQLLGERQAEHYYVAFDLLWLDGEDLRQRPLEERRERLEAVLAGAPPRIQLAERIEGPVVRALAEARERGLEGVIAKRRGSPYSGKRSSDWLKLKVTQSQEVAIVGFTPSSKSGNEVGALLLAVYQKAPKGAGGSRFLYAGKVGTGFTDKMRKELLRLLKKDRVEKPPVADPPRERDAVWVQPRYVAQVAFTEWTRDGKLRHPSFQGLRDDKKPEDCIREVPQK
jgi:bifunctional non-homologous end joining protein LigD